MTTLEGLEVSSDQRLQQFPDTPNHSIRLFSNYLKGITDELKAAECSKVFLLASKSLDTNTSAIKSIETALGAKVVGKKTGKHSASPTDRSEHEHYS